MTLTRNLEVIGSDSEHPGLYTIGVLVDGAFVTLAAVKLGTLEQMKNVPTAVEAADQDGDSSSTDTEPTA